MSAPRAGPCFSVRSEEDQLQLAISGDWSTLGSPPQFFEIEQALDQHNTGASTLVITAAELTRWDSLLLGRLLRCHRWCESRRLSLDSGQLPDGINALLGIATSVRQRTGDGAAHAAPRPLLRVLAAQGRQAVVDFSSFVGSLILALAAFARGRSHTRVQDLLHFAGQAGPGAMAIITLISVLVGMILAYMGAIQLRQFGAQIYIANLVAVGMVREMASLMTAIIMAGRTGAAYAAQLGTMQTNEEVDAITTLGMSPMEFLVTPRVLALILVMPLLCIYSNFLGIAGGALVAAGLDVSPVQYFSQVQGSISWADVSAGLIKGVVYAALIAIAGCQEGMQCGRSSAAVGDATTRAVVKAIVLIVCADSALNILFEHLEF